MNSLRSLLAFSLATPALLLGAEVLPPAWSAASYSDESGYQQRIAGMVERIAAQDYLRRTMASSTCPDTGLPVYTWAVEGEEITSPYTGRRYRQGPTGYFGPKARDADGRITAFGGDPLKQALPPAAATLLLASQRGENFVSAEKSPTPATTAYAYLSIPGNLRQQYHFAATNWVRLLGLVGPQLPAEWHEKFRAAIAVYDENRKPSDGPVREYQPLEHTENLIGRSEELLGGGGTENHKTMWRSSGLLYAQTFPPGSRISGFELTDAEERTTKVLTSFVRRLFTLGNGEYDSSTYYPYSFRAFVNLYDFSPRPATRAWAQAALDYYFATYGLKIFNGVHTGPQRRGWVEGGALAEMDAHWWAYAGGQPNYTTVPVDSQTLTTSFHQATSTYRPNQLIVDLLARGNAHPFEAFFNHPDYGMTNGGVQPEYFYRSASFAMGSVQMDAVNNSAQQTTWSLNVRGRQGSLIFGGGQPRWLHPEGHSPYDQWVQKRGALLLMSAPTVAQKGAPAPRTLERIDQLEGPKSYSRQTSFSGPLATATPPPSGPEFASWFAAQRTAAATWLFVPRSATVHETSGRYVVETADTFVVITPFNAGACWLDGPDAASELPTALRVLREYRVLIVPGATTGFAIEAVERSQFPDLASLRGSELKVDGLVARYRSLGGDSLELRYQPTELRPAAVINGEAIDWQHWAGGAVCDSPFLKINAGRMWVSNGSSAYEMDFTGESPVWRTSQP